MTARDTEEDDDQAAGCVRDREDAKGGVYSGSSRELVV